MKDNKEKNIKQLTGVDIGHCWSEELAEHVFDIMVLNYKDVVALQSASGCFAPEILLFVKEFSPGVAITDEPPTFKDFTKEEVLTMIGIKVLQNRFK